MSDLNQLAINDEGFIFDPSSGESFTVNRTGLLILKGLKESKSQHEIAQVLADRFDVTEDEAERDTSDFLSRLKTFGME